MEGTLAIVVEKFLGDRIGVGRQFVREKFSVRMNSRAIDNGHLVIAGQIVPRSTSLKLPIEITPANRAATSADFLGLNMLPLPFTCNLADYIIAPPNCKMPLAYAEQCAAFEKFHVVATYNLLYNAAILVREGMG